MVITISREYGAAALRIAHLVAERLGYLFVHDQLPSVVAARFGTTPEQVDAIAHAGPPLGERILSALGMTTPEVAQSAYPIPETIDASVRRAIEEEIRRFAAAGDCVILGRIGSRIVGRGPDRLRVFLAAEHTWKLAHLCEAFGMDQRAAKREIDRVDEARKRYAREHYGFLLGDAREYDLTLDVARFGVDGAVELILAAVHTASGVHR